jgi:cystathionine gamma-lyase
MDPHERQDHGRRFETLAVTAGEEPEAGADEVGDVTVPIHLASTFAVPDVDMETELDDLDPGDDEYLYSRLANPTRRAFEERMAALEDATHGLGFASGSAAINATITAVVEPGDHVVAFDDLYGGTRTMLKELFRDRLNVDVTFVDARDPSAVAGATRPETELVWLETPTNPLLRLCDVETIVELVGDDVVVGVDNTFASPYFQQPLALGADVSVHSTTKYLNGHSDAIGGAVMTDDDELAGEIQFMQQVAMGNMVAPFDAYQVLRGTKTLPMRMRRHEENATAVAEFLVGHELVETVNYPGLESHPQHELATRQMSGYGGVVSAELATDFEGVRHFLAATEAFALAVSLGGVESLVEHPASMTHSPLTAEERAELGISESLLRFSVGVEATEDLLTDLEWGLQAVEQYHADAGRPDAVRRES